MGGELNYNHMSLKNGAQDSIGPILVTGANLPDGSTVYYTVTVASAASVTIHDILTARARAGWTFDRFMPYGFAGVAVGRADVIALYHFGRQHKDSNATADNRHRRNHDPGHPVHGLFGSAPRPPSRRRKTA